MATKSKEIMIHIDTETYQKITENAKKNNQVPAAYTAKLLTELLSENPTIVIDYTTLQQLLLNQIDTKNKINNFINYLNEDGKITLSDCENLISMNENALQNLTNSINDLINAQSKTKSQIQKYLRKRLRK